MTEINPGDVRRVSGSFTNPAGVATDPTTISVRWRHHRGTETTWVYGTDTQVVRDSAGVFHADIPITVSGLYYYKFEGTGAVQAAEEGTFLAETFFESVAPSTPSGPIRLYTGTADPTTGAGVPAAIGSVYSRTLLGSESVWVKTGTADTAWVQSGSAGGGVAGLTITDGTTEVVATRMSAPLVADAGAGEASVLPGISYDVGSALLVFETGGPTVGIRWPNGTGGQPLFKLTAGSIDMQNANGYLEIIDPEAPSAGFYTQPSNSTSVTVGGNYGHRFMVLTDAGGVVVMIEADGSVKMPSLPTTDPAVVGQLWVDSSGFVKRSTG